MKLYRTKSSAAVETSFPRVQHNDLPDVFFGAKNYVVKIEIEFVVAGDPSPLDQNRKEECDVFMSKLIAEKFNEIEL